jgi:hypothetical protein
MTLPTLSKKHFVIGGITLAVILLISISVYFFLQYQHSQALLKNPAEAAKSENKDIAKKIALLVDVPSDEEPTVAVVSDVEKLRNQPFFAKAENNDRVIFYPSTKRAILYRPNTGKIIEMSPVNVDQQAKTDTAPVVAGAEAPTPTKASLLPAPTAVPVARAFRLAIYNGTATSKLANNMEKTLSEQLPIATVVKKDNAVRNTYNKTLIVDVSGINDLETKALAGVIPGSVVTTLPPGENKPDSDILVIIGSDWKP